MNKAKGFTLIELVVVIVILGILSVVAAPKFLNLQDDARNASLDGLKGAMQGASDIVYGKAAIENVETLSKDEEDSEVEGIDTHYGYPEASEEGIAKAVQGLDSGQDWAQVSPTNTKFFSDGAIHYTFADKAENQNITDCYVTYEEAETEGEYPTVTVTSCNE